MHARCAAVLGYVARDFKIKSEVMGQVPLFFIMQMQGGIANVYKHKNVY